jgi:hypothetical protein
MNRYLIPSLLLLSCAAARGDEPLPINLQVGSALNLCKEGLTVCPVTTSMCDDPKVAVIENEKEGAVVRGISPGTTLCAIMGSGAFRRVMKVTVTTP